MEINKKIFRQEVNLIQQRHLLYFPVSQERFVKIKIVNDTAQLIFTKNCILDKAIRLEIMMAFKLSETFNGKLNMLIKKM